MFVLLCLYCCVVAPPHLQSAAVDLGVCLYPDKHGINMLMLHEWHAVRVLSTVVFEHKFWPNKQTDKQTNKQNKQTPHQSSCCWQTHNIQLDSRFEELMHKCKQEVKLHQLHPGNTHTHTHTHARTHTLKPLISSSPLTLESIDWFIDPSHWQRRDLTWVQPPWM